MGFLVGVTGFWTYRRLAPRFAHRSLSCRAWCLFFQTYTRLQARSRFSLSSLTKGKRESFRSPFFLLVGVTGFEPAASTSQRKRQQSFASFWVLFGAFLSENRAFSCRKVHNSHVVQTCKWSKLWSDLKSHIICPTSNEPQALFEVDFLLLPLYHKTEDISSPLTVKYLRRCNQR